MTKMPDDASIARTTPSLDAVTRRVADRLRQKNTNTPLDVLARADPARSFSVGRWVYLLIDCSGSMTPSKIAEAKQGSRRFMADAIGSRYSVGVITFAAEPNLLSEPTANPLLLDRLLADGLHAPGTSTALDLALVAARSDLENRGGTRAIVVFTDGMPDDEGRALAEAAKAKEKGIDLIAVGTEDANLSFLERLASAKELAVQRSIPGVADAIAQAAQLLPSENPRSQHTSPTTRDVP